MRPLLTIGLVNDRMEVLKWTGYDLAAASGIQPKRLAKLIRQQVHPTRREVNAIADALALHPNDLTEPDEDVMPP